MSDLDKILLTSVTTVIGGLIIFSFGQLLLKFIIEPLHGNYSGDMELFRGHNTD
jgi:hypothetical protein